MQTSIFRVHGKSKSHIIYRGHKRCFKELQFNYRYLLFLMCIIIVFFLKRQRKKYNELFVQLKCSIHSLWRRQCNSANGITQRKYDIDSMSILAFTQIFLQIACIFFVFSSLSRQCDQKLLSEHYFGGSKRKDTCELNVL